MSPQQENTGTKWAVSQFEYFCVFRVPGGFQDFQVILD